jgi:hypothetical protein
LNLPFFSQTTPAFSKLSPLVTAYLPTANITVSNSSVFSYSSYLYVTKILPSGFGFSSLRGIESGKNLV